MSTIVLEAEVREAMGKGASRRLRRLENKIPAIVYGSDKAPKPIYLLQNKVSKALENESIYSSMFSLTIDGKNEHVILKDIQHHPYKQMILHMDFQRVSSKDTIVKAIPLHFLNEENALGVKVGGIITHTLTQVEVRCQVKHLPEFIEVDLANVNLDEVVHLSSLKLPKGVELTMDVKDPHQDLSVASIHRPRGVVLSADEEEAPPAEETEEPSEN